MKKFAATRVVASLTLIATLSVPAQAELGAMGIGVADLDASAAFYAETLGLKALRTYELGYLNEIVMGYGDSTGAVVVLMNWPDQDREYDGNNVKLVFYVENPTQVIERIRARGFEIIREALPIEALNGRTVGLGRDPDNYVIELVQSDATE